MEPQPEDRTKSVEVGAQSHRDHGIVNTQCWFPSPNQEICRNLKEDIGFPESQGHLLYILKDRDTPAASGSYYVISLSFSILSTTIVLTLCSS